MAHADFLLRNPLPSSLSNSRPDNKVTPKRVNIVELSPNWLAAEQQRDSELIKVIDDLSDCRLEDSLASTYVLRSGILHRKFQRNGRTRCLPIVSHALKWSVINNIHDSLIHLRWEKTLEMVYDHYWFEGMSRYVKRFVENCVTCKVAKCRSGKIQAEL